MVAVQAVRKMLEGARVADAKDGARLRESQLRINSPKKMKLDDRLEIQPTKTEEPKSDDRVEPQEVDVHPTKIDLEDLELDGRSELLKVEVRSKMLGEPNESRSPKMPVGGTGDEREPAATKLELMMQAMQAKLEMMERREEVSKEKERLRGLADATKEKTQPRR